ncbi:hypothetical protein [Xanthomonas albilineans]|uniref:hypothetical protein n=1 Tax=Xanthomonas albilineans TaxID=29447 RepID=UPI000B1EC07B|nr:hypothetical protein [Xanthomonas albilineans]
MGRVSAVVDKDARELPISSAIEPRLPPAVEMALHCGERRKVARLIFDHYPEMSLREAIVMVQRYRRLELSVAAGPTVAAGKRASVWRWGIPGLLFAVAVAAVAWWLYR